jgi:hypothetical protein
MALKLSYIWSTASWSSSFPPAGPQTFFQLVPQAFPWQAQKLSFTWPLSFPSSGAPAASSQAFSSNFPSARPLLSSSDPQAFLQLIHKLSFIYP